MKSLKFISIGGLLIGLFFGYQQYSKVSKAREEHEKTMQAFQKEMEIAEKEMKEARDKANRDINDTIKK
jgi:cell division protein FtsB